MCSCHEAACRGRKGCVFSIRSVRHTHLLALFALALVAAASATVFAHLRPRALAPDGAVTWRETEWKMPLDNWGEGRAWHATASGGADIMLLARTKTGFCNCFRGIADDVEIDRIGDVDLHGDNFTPSAPGEATAVGDLPGRKRLFQVSSAWSGKRDVLSIVAATDCKAVVATLVSDEAIPAEAEASAVALLTGESFRRWAADR